MIRYKISTRQVYENAKTSTESSVGISSLLKGERFYSLLVLFLLLTTTFFPLIGGKNFIPFEKYPTWSHMLARSSGQELRFESPVVKRLKTMPWADQEEPSSLAINWPENLYFVRQLKCGKLPLWDPYTGGGVPTLDSTRNRPFNPFFLPFYLFPTTWMCSLTWLAGLVFGGIGAYLWLSRRGLSTPAVTLGSGLFALNPWVLDRLVLTDSAAYLVLPWCLLTLEQTTWRNWPSIARAVLCFVLMGHSGQPEACIIMAGLAACVHLFSEKKPGIGQESFAEKTKTLGVVAAFTLACLTVLWLPLLKLFIIGDCYKKRVLLVYVFSWRSLITLPSDMFIVPTIGGILACIFLAWKKIPKIWVALFSVVVLLLFPLPWIADLSSKLLNYLKLPAFYLKGLFWASLSFMIPYGLDAYRASKKSSAITAFVIGGSMLVLAGWQFNAFPMAKNDISAFPIAAFVLFALGLLSLVIFRTARGRFFPLLMCGMVLAPLAFPLSLNKLLWNTVDFKTNSVVEWLKSNRPNARTVSVGSKFIFAIPPNLGQAYGIRCAEVIGVIFLNNYRSMFRHPRAIPTSVAFDFFSPDAFKHMGADTLLSLNDVSAKGLDLLVKGPLFSAYSIPGAHGRLYFAERASHYKPGTNFPTQVLSLSQDTDAVAIVEGMGNPVPEVIPEIPSGRGKAVFERDDANEVIVRTECSSEGLLVLRDSWYPSWLAFIDGKRSPIFRINGCFRGVIVPAGGHTVRFVYRPILVYIAGLVSFLASLLVILVSIRKNQKGRRGSPTGPLL